MKSWMKKTLAVAIVLTALAAGAVPALPTNGYAVTDDEAQGNIVGESALLRQKFLQR
jgi:hypothetical protein